MGASNHTMLVRHGRQHDDLGAVAERRQGVGGVSISSI